MSLRQQFDDLLRHLGERQPPHCERGFAEAAAGSAALPEMLADADAELCRLRKAVARRERQRDKLQDRLRSDRFRVELEEKRTKEAEEEKRHLESLLDNVRGLILGGRPDTTSAEIISMIESVSSDRSAHHD